MKGHRLSREQGVASRRMPMVVPTTRVKKEERGAVPEQSCFQPAGTCAEINGEGMT